jgi:hypothetical protein
LTVKTNIDCQTWYYSKPPPVGGFLSDGAL